VCKRFLRPRPLFILKFLYFSYNLIFCEFIGRVIREDRASFQFCYHFARKSFYQGHRPRGSCAFFSYSPTATDETTFSVLFTIDVYHYLVIFDFIHVNSHLLE